MKTYALNIVKWPIWIRYEQYEFQYDFSFSVVSISSFNFSLITWCLNGVISLCYCQRIIDNYHIGTISTNQVHLCLYDINSDIVISFHLINFLINVIVPIFYMGCLYWNNQPKPESYSKLRCVSILIRLMLSAINYQMHFHRIDS